MTPGSDHEPIHPAVADAQELLALEQECEDDCLRRVYRAVMISPTLTVCRALLNGERVPFSRLDLDAVNRYGLREILCAHCGKAPDRITVDDLNDVPSKLKRWPEGHLELVANRSKSPSGRPSPRLELVSVRGRQSRES